MTDNERCRVAIIEENESMRGATDQLLTIEGYDVVVWNGKQKMDDFVSDFLTKGIQIILVSGFERGFSGNVAIGERHIERIRRNAPNSFIIGRGEIRELKGADTNVQEISSPEKLLQTLVSARNFLSESNK